ncbi:MAG: hypothetical protein KDJ50_08085 [Alphaproteobacteria bacterium]|nr:hypothetical protein [Alphaproteobacteria bacterium]
MPDPLSGREIIIEFYSIGPLVKVSAVDVLTMTEISIQGPASAGDAILKKNALNRLTYILRKKGLIV